MAQLWELKRKDNRTQLIRKEISPVEPGKPKVFKPPVETGEPGADAFELTDVKGVGDETAKILIDNGIDAEEKLRAVALSDLQALGIGPRAIAGIQKWQEGEE